MAAGNDLRLWVGWTLAGLLTFWASTDAFADPEVCRVLLSETKLVRLADQAPIIAEDLRYKTSENWLGRPVYPATARVYVMPEVAKALARVEARLEARGLGLVVFDGYRPWSVTQLFWRAAQPRDRIFLADPEVGSDHNRGIAVDVSLRDLTTGAEIQMPSQFDEMSPAAFKNYPGGNSSERAFRDLLDEVMRSEGFTGIPEEWWHFVYSADLDRPVMDIGFPEIEARIHSRGRGTSF